MSADTDALTQFAADLQQQVASRAEVAENGAFHEELFTEIMIDYLGEAGVLENAEVCLHRARGMQVSGYAISDNNESLDVLVTIHTGTVPPTTVFKSDAATAFKRAVEFFTRSCAGYHDEVEESGAVFDAAQQIYDAYRGHLVQIRFTLLTDGVVKNAPPNDTDLPGLRVNYEIWDIERLFRFVTSGRQREPIEIDFEQTIGCSVPCLAQPDTTPGYAAYLSIFPARAIVELYGKYGSRLLERNVRSFLQARGKVNAGMRDTIRNEPGMFLAFNNGLSATAESVCVVDLPGGGKGLRSIRDLQIVNGGQTTASIFHAVKRDKADVSQLFVQVKLTVLNDPTQMDAVVPLISRFANTQNRIQEADLAANDAFHRKVEEYSRTVWAPARNGTLRQTRWFYERARASYQDERQRAGASQAKLREFDATYPKVQLFTKTDLAKAIVTWQRRPDIVSKGAQACFVWFMAHLEELQQDDPIVEPRAYERLVAKLILFRSAERLIKDRNMGFTGYWANLVTYTVARLVHATDGWIDLARIWKEQRIGEVLETGICDLARTTWSHINSPYGGANVTQYCKQERCWTTYRERDVYLSGALKSETIERRNISASSTRGTAQTVALSENAARLKSVTAAEWFRLHTWAKANAVLDNLQLSQVLTFATEAGSNTSRNTRQIHEAIKILDTAKLRGFPNPP